MELILLILMLTAGFFLLVKGADWFVSGASAMAEKLGISPIVIGLTVVAMGTSLPEAAVSISAVIKGNAEITIGNVVGSNILNILMILGLSAMVSVLKVKKSTVRYELPFLMGISILLVVQGIDGRIGFADGLLQIILFALYLAYLFLAAKKSRIEGEKKIIDKNNKKVWQIILLCVFGLIMTIVGSSMVVEAACIVAARLGLSERLIGLTIVALGTSLPELVTSVTAAKKGNSDIAIGNIVGSNIFNILFVIGISSLVHPVAFAEIFRFDSIVSAAAALFLVIFCAKEGRLKRWHGAVLLTGYMIYFAAIVL
ncbi:MAG: calcium/sodium antiporter [Clostridiales bacterium]|nr:calcium/sodium antiporter [Clostridiales bacterium]